MQHIEVSGHVGERGALALPVADEGIVQVMDRLRTERLELAKIAVVLAVVVDNLDGKDTALQGLRGGLPGSHEGDDEGGANNAEHGGQHVFLAEDHCQLREPWHRGLLSVSEW